MPRPHSAFYGSALLLVSVAGCVDHPPPPTATDSGPVAPSPHFDPTTAGAVRGRVTWSGPLPRVPPFQIASNLPAEAGPSRLYPEPNPNIPTVGPGGGVADVVVFLRGTSPDAARPWDHPPVRVEQRGRRLHVVQGAADSRAGFVRRGDAVEMTSKDATFHALRADGAAFFTLAFPDPDQPSSRRLTEAGLVELSSAAGYYWMRAYLFVADHPYYARTDAEGRFVLPQVPPGRYEVVCWHPSWVKGRAERDAESGLLARLFFRRALERVRGVNLEPKRAEEVTFTVGEADFAPGALP